MTVTQTPPPLLASRRWRWVLSLLVLGGLVLFVGGLGISYVTSDRRLQAAIEETDRLDPGWRLSEIEASYDPIPDDLNSARTIAAVKLKLPPRWPEWDHPTNMTREVLDDPAEEDLPPPELLPLPAEQEWPQNGEEMLPGEPGNPPGMSDPTVDFMAFSHSLGDLSPALRLSQEQADRIRVEITRAADAIQIARTIADQPRGRHVMKWSVDWISTLLTEVQETREVASLLGHDAVLRAHDGDREGALLSCRAILNTGNSLGDNPTFIGQLVHIALRAIARGKIERVIAQGPVSPEALAALQARLAEEAEQPLLTIALRGERAGLDVFFQAIQRGDVKISQLSGLIGLAGSGGNRGGKLIDEVQMLRLPGAVAASRAAMLRQASELVEISKLPLDQQATRIEAVIAERDKQPLLVREFLPTVDSMLKAVLRTVAEMRFTMTALAVERYRLKHGHWPVRLDHLVPEFLPAVPLDPYDGKPLRYGRRDEGVIVYSVGQDLSDNGGHFDRLKPGQNGNDMGFRLWDVERRGKEQK